MHPQRSRIYASLVNTRLLKGGESQWSTLTIRMTKLNYEYFLLDMKDNSVFQGLLSCLIYFPTPCFLQIEICSLFLFLKPFTVVRVK